MTAVTVGRRVLLAVLMLAVGLVHVLDLPGKWEETRWMGLAYLALIATCVLVADLLLRGVGNAALALTAGAAAGPLIGFVLTRTVGLPGAQGDIGNWSEPLGLASLFVETVALLVLVTVVVDQPRGRVVRGAHAAPASHGAGARTGRRTAGALPAPRRAPAEQNAPLEPVDTH